jgi:phycocyanin-associated, rod
MLAQSSSRFDNRIFVYEVTGLCENSQTENNAYSVRSSSSSFIQVPLDRMNEEMRRISRLGGKIVAIRPLAAVSASPKQEREQSKEGRR